MASDDGVEMSSKMGVEVREHLQRIELKLDSLSRQMASISRVRVSDLGSELLPNAVHGDGASGQSSSQHGHQLPVGGRRHSWAAMEPKAGAPLGGPRAAASAWRDLCADAPAAGPGASECQIRSESSPTRLGRSASSIHGREAVQVNMKGMMQDAPKLTKYMQKIGLSELWGRIQMSVERTTKERPYRVVRGTGFQLAVCSVILLQGLLIGYGASNAFNVEAYGDTPAVWVDYFEIAFCCFFAIELVARVSAERLTFIFGSEWKWNIFDVVLVLLSFSDLIANGTQSGEFGGVAVGRILRLSRFFALMRMSRVMRQLPSLRIILMSILDSMVSLVWCFVFIGFIMYVFAVFVVYGMADFLRNDAAPEDALERELRMWWGGVYRSMVTLFMTISGGVDWVDVVRPLRAIGGLYEPLFLFYIFLMCFGVLNVVLGAFVATTQQIAMNDPEAAAKYAAAQLESYIHRIRGFFKQADVQQSGTLSWDEFKSTLEKPKVRSYFEALDLDLSQAHVLFDLLDTDQSGSVTVEEFIEGCVRLRGHARSIDVNKIVYMCERMFDRLPNMLE